MFSIIFWILALATAELAEEDLRLLDIRSRHRFCGLFFHTEAPAKVSVNFLVIHAQRLLNTCSAFFISPFPRVL